MTDYEFPETPEIEKAYRAAYKALSALAPGTVTVEEETLFLEVLSQFPFLLDRADLATTARLGPAVSWQASRQDDDWGLAVSGLDLDLDGDEHDFGGAVLGAEVTEGPDGRWHGSALDRAGLAYKRACGWDFAPGESGVWLLMLAPVAASGGEEGCGSSAAVSAGSWSFTTATRMAPMSPSGISGPRPRGNAAGSRDGC